MSKFGDSYTRARSGAKPESGAEGCGRALGLVTALFLVALFAMLAWNIGVVGIVTASGGHVAKIGYWTAFFALVGVRLVASAVAKAVRSAE